ncbi:MAG: hypothetical protein AAB430_00275 [Patescibacteria group bacterium]
MSIPQEERVLDQDEHGFYEWRRRPTEKVLEEIGGRGINISDFEVRVKEAEKSLEPDTREGRIFANELRQEAEFMALLQLNVMLPVGQQVDLCEKVYFSRERASGQIGGGE